MSPYGAYCLSPPRSEGKKMMGFHKLPLRDKMPVDRTAVIVYNVGDVCVRTFPALCRVGDKTRRTRTVSDIGRVV
jgi:hypothetical protein